MTLFLGHLLSQVLLPWPDIGDYAHKRSAPLELSLNNLWLLCTLFSLQRIQYPEQEDWISLSLHTWWEKGREGSFCFLPLEILLKLEWFWRLSNLKMTVSLKIFSYFILSILRFSSQRYLQLKVSCILLKIVFIFNPFLRKTDGNEHTACCSTFHFFFCLTYSGIFCISKEI